ncbi:MAG: hypothetical protein ABI548_24885 [Polyangiaceae bacterium]
MRRTLVRLAFALQGLSALGCAQASLPALRVSAQDQTPWPPLAVGQPLIISFKAGQRIPVSVQVDGEIIETSPTPSIIWLTAKRDFAVRIQGSDIKTSLDGVHFDEKPAVPGHFQFGVQATRDAGAQVSVRVTTPVHASARTKAQ